MNIASFNTIARAIEDILRHRLTGLAVDGLTLDSDLVIDTGLDSVQFMQLLVALEREYHITVPDTLLDASDLSTIRHLAEQLADCTQADDAPGAAAAPADLSATGTPATGTTATGVQEPPLDIKVHCLVSCLCEPIRNNPDIDHRPFYFGIWDAQIFIDAQGHLTYHDEAVDHQFFTDWFARLYQVTIERWYDPACSAAKNLATLQTLLTQRQPQQTLLVMLDLFHLPERENRFNKNPFPHYVMLENTAAPDLIWMWDPDFRWEGALDRSRVFNAIQQPSVGGGYRIDYALARQPDDRAVAAYFRACIKPLNNPMTAAARMVVEAHTADNPARPLHNLPVALSELPVLAIRKYAYEHGLAFFWRALQLPEALFEQWCDRIEALVRGYDRVVFLATALCETPSAEHLEDLHTLLREQDHREFTIKQELLTRFDQWQSLTESHNNLLARAAS